MKPNLERREWLVLALFVVSAVLVRLFFLKYKHALTGDGVWYATLGRNLASGDFAHGLSTYWPPLYPLLIGLASIVFSDVELSGRLVSVLAGGLLVLPVYLLIRSSNGKTAATLGAFLIAISPLEIYWSTFVLTESTYTLLLMTAILVGWFALAGGKKAAFFATGLGLGACYLVKPEAFGYVGLMIVLTLATKLLRNQLRATTVLSNSALLLVGFMLFSLPYVIYLRNETGRWTISGKFAASFASPVAGKDKWRSLTEDGQTTLADTLWAGTRVEGGSDRKVSTAITDAPKIRLPRIRILIHELKGLEDVVPEAFILMTFLGLFRTSWSKKRAAREVYLFLFIISTLIGYYVAGVETRYLIALLPIFICWASVGIIEFEIWLTESVRQVFSPGFSRLASRTVVLFLIVGGLVLSQLSAVLELFQTETWGGKPVAAWIKDHATSTPLIMANSPMMAFYADGKHLYIPNDEYSVVLNYAARKKVDYLVIEEINSTPNLKFLLDEQSQHPGLNLAYNYSTIPRGKMLVFELAETSR